MPNRSDLLERSASIVGNEQGHAHPDVVFRWERTPELREPRIDHLIGPDRGPVPDADVGRLRQLEGSYVPGANPVPTVTLANGVVMPALGFGTAQMTDAQATRLVVEAIGVGYRLFDTATSYGNERGVGEAIRVSGISRDEIFITTKFDGRFQGFEEAQQAFAECADRLGTDYIDLLLIHWPLPALGRYVDAWRGMIKLLGEGKVRAIGVSNFKPAHIDHLLEATGVAPHVNQVQLNPRTSLPEERAYHSAHDIVTDAWSPLDKGKESIKWRRYGRRLRRWLRGEGRNLLEEEAIVSAAKRHSKTPAQVVLRWHVQLGNVPITKTTSGQRMVENLDVFDFELSAAELASISSLDRGKRRYVDPDTHGH